MKQEKYIVVKDFDGQFLRVDFSNDNSIIPTPFKLSQGEVLTSVMEAKVVEGTVMVIDRIMQTVVVSDYDLVNNLALIDEDKNSNILVASPALFVSRADRIAGSDATYCEGDDITVILDNESYTGKFVSVDWGKYEDEENDLNIEVDGQLLTFGISTLKDIL